MSGWWWSARIRPVQRWAGDGFALAPETSPSGPPAYAGDPEAIEATLAYRRGTPGRRSSREVAVAGAEGLESACRTRRGREIGGVAGQAGDGAVDCGAAALGRPDENLTGPMALDILDSEGPTLDPPAPESTAAA